VATAAAALLGACGGQGTPEEEVTKSVRNWSAALSEGNGDAACEAMTPTARAELAAFAGTYAKTGPAGDCAANVRRFMAKLTGIPRRQMHDADVDDIRIADGVATVAMADGGPNELVLRQADGEWRIEHAFRKGWRLMGAPSYGMTGR
jgi:hypothetical protein